MIETYKILNEIDDDDYRTWFTFVNEQHQMTRQSVKVADDGTVTKTMKRTKPKTRLEVRKNFFSCIVVDNWNNLPVHVKNAGNVLDFKSRYDDNTAGKQIPKQRIMI